MKSLSKIELDAFLKVALSHSEADYAMFLIAFNHGLRISEVLALTPENVISGNLITQRLKGSRKTVQALLPSEREIVAGLVSKGGRFFSVCRMTAWRRFKAYAKEAGIPTGRDFATPHSLKHTCGRLGFKGGMDVAEIQKYLGHVNGANTMIYIQATEDEACAAFAAAVGA